MSKIKWKDRSSEYKEGWEDGSTFVKMVVYGFFVFLIVIIFLIEKCS